MADEVKPEVKPQKQLQAKNVLALLVIVVVGFIVWSMVAAAQTPQNTSFHYSDGNGHTLSSHCTTDVVAGTVNCTSNDNFSKP
jgi:nitrate/nitrite transporter NarK